MTDATTVSYDYGGRKTALDDPDMGVLTYEYNAQGGLLRQEDAKGQSICMYYDLLGRLAGKHYPKGNTYPSSPAFAVEYGYDDGAYGIGQRTTMTDTVGVTGWDYDAILTMSNLKRIIWVVILVTTLLSSCLSQKISNNDIAGVWGEENDSDTIVAGIDCASIEFFENGKFKAYNIPIDYFNDIAATTQELDPHLRVDSTGRWKLRPPTRDPFSLRLVELKFDEISDVLIGESIMYLTVLGEPMLFTGYDALDFGEVIFFSKNEDDWCE